MDENALALVHSVEAAVSPSFAWSFRTDITTWIDPPATFALDGPFVAGARGTTTIPGQPPLSWHIREVLPGKSFLIEMPLEQATLCFLWQFDALSERRTRVTQRIQLSGSNAGAYVEQLRAVESNLPGAMQRTAATMAAAEQASQAE
jgi:hypothetical protein